MADEGEETKEGATKVYHSCEKAKKLVELGLTDKKEIQHPLPVDNGGTAANESQLWSLLPFSK